MIKILRNKFLICMFLLVVSIFITSCCYASEKYTYGNFDITIDKEAKTLRVLNTVSKKSKTYDISYGLDNYSKYYFQVNSYNQYTSLYSEHYNFGLVFANSFKWVNHTYNSVTKKVYTIATAYGYYFDYGVKDGVASFGCPWNEVPGFAETSNTYNARGEYQLVLDSSYNYYYPNTVILCASDTIKTSNGVVLYEPKPDTSFDYSFEGVKRGQVKLSVENLNTELRMYGYVGLDKTFSIGDTLDITSNSSNLRLLASRTDNSDLYCYLYEGEELNYYIVDENNVILDTGYISEMAKGYFLYGFKVNDGVDFVFLKDGQVYWDNNLTFKYSLYDVESENNNIVSAGESTYIESDKTVSSSKYSGYVYDSSNSLIAQAYTTSSNDLSSLAIEVDTSYEEDKTFANEGIWSLNFITLKGTNSDGTLIDFSEYYIRWSVPTDIEIIEICVSHNKYDKRNGIFDNPNSYRYVLLFLVYS